MKSLLERRISRFWTLQFIVWMAYGLISFAGALPYVGLVPHLDSVRSAFIHRAMFSAVGLLSTGLLRLIYQRECERATSLFRTAVTVVLLSYVAGLAASAGANLAREVVSGKHTGGWATLFGGAVSASAIFFAWSTCYFAIRAHQEMEKEKQDALRAKAAAHEAQLAALRGQVNPHFLFNSLNSIQALIRENPSSAQAAVGELAGLLRYSLRQNGSAEVCLSEELEAIEKYLSIEKIRFEEKLMVRMEIQPEAEGFRVPCFLFHPLVENAVKYGMQTSTMPLQLRIRAERCGDSLRFEIANTGKWLENGKSCELSHGAGLGLRLVRERLEQACPGQYQFECLAEKGWVTQRIEIGKPTGRIRHAASRAAGG
jgi:two-component system, LytTR family, sensor kinase